MMDKGILARNIRISRQTEELAAVFLHCGIPAVLLKGAALIQVFPAYCAERMMEDIDILLRPQDLAAARSLLLCRGYRPSPEDPCAFLHPEKAAYVDLADSLWYLSRKENREVFDESRRHALTGLSPLMFHLPPPEFFLHVLAHAAVHHARKEKAWARDLELLQEKWGKDWDNRTWEEKLKRYGLRLAARHYLFPGAEDRSLSGKLYQWFLAKDTPQKGHLSRFFFLPSGKKLSYLVSTLFPAEDFLVHRYCIKNRPLVPLYRLLRPFFLLSRLAAWPFHLLSRS
ncbi:MAG: nucleotidyltransferase family protein [Endomicrobiales bacterium]